MEVVATSLLLLTACFMGWYVITLVSYWLAWRNRSTQEESSLTSAQKSAVSILIPCRNEAKHITACLHSIASQITEGHRCEIFVVDDHSEDETADCVRQFQTTHPQHVIRLLQLSEEEKGKKAALSMGIAHAQHDIILTCDADCIYPAQWLSAMLNTYQNSQAKMVIGPVLETGTRSWLQHIISLESMALMGVTAGSTYLDRPTLCNGANLLYERSAFTQVGGFSNTDFSPGGDDVLLLHKIKRLGNIAMAPIASARCTTAAPLTIKHWWRQRLRWAAKSTRYSDRATTRLTILIFFTHLLIPLTLLATNPFAMLFIGTVSLLLIKIGIDFLFLLLVSRRVNGMRHLYWFLPAELFIFLSNTIIPLASQFFPYQWKSRSFKP